MLEILQVILIILCLISGILGTIMSITLYSKRVDKSFFGGSKLLNGWGLFNPYGDDGIGEKTKENKQLVLYLRISVVAMYFFGYAAYKLREYIN